MSEQSPEYAAEYGPEYAHAVADILTLLGEAERAGLQSDRAQKLRDQLERSPHLTPARISDIERSIRKWLARREDARQDAQDDVTADRLLP